MISNRQFLHVVLFDIVLFLLIPCLGLTFAPPIAITRMVIYRRSAGRI